MTHIVTAHTFAMHINCANITLERNMNYIMTFLDQNQRSKSLFNVHVYMHIEEINSIHHENLAR